MQDSALASLFSGRKGMILVSTKDYAEPPVIDSVRPGQVGTYPPGWEPLSATSSQTLISLDLSEDESDSNHFDVLDNLCSRLHYITLKVSQLSMRKQVFARTFGAGSWDENLRAFRAAGEINPSYRSVLVLFFGEKNVMGAYFSRVKLLAGESLLKPSSEYFMECPVIGYVQEPVDARAGKYLLYEPRERIL